MAKFVLARNYTLVTLTGRSIEFRKGVPQHVPPDCIRAAVAIGATPADGKELNLDLEGDEASRLPKAPTEPTMRLEAIDKVIRQLIQRNDRDDFTAAGLPSPKVIERTLGWKVDAREVRAVWQDYCNEQAAIQEQLRSDERANQTAA